MVVVREHGPGFDPPIILIRDREQPAMEHGQPFCTAEVVVLQIRTDTEEVRAAFGKQMGWCMRNVVTSIE